MKNLKQFLLLFTIILLILTSSLKAQFLSVDGKNIVDDDGMPYISRSMGLGGWMLQEGYMLETGDFAGPQWKIKQTISNLIGITATETFYEAWRANHCTKSDIDSLASWGFNTVRLPMHYNLFTFPIQQEPVQMQDTWLTTGFEMVDSLLAWCKANNMHLILDLHAAPGGQGKDANISDYNPAYPSLWQSAENKRKTIALWKKLAEKYANEPYIAAYDLINEPNWAFRGANQNGCDESDNAEIEQFYKDITSAIRSVDTTHIIIIEGNCWGNNYNGIEPTWDNKLVVSFHKYWNATDASTIKSILDIRNKYNVPIWMGESGENSNQWFYETIKMLEENNIGWSWWPMKKINSVVGPLTVVKTPEYQMLLDYWRGTGERPTKEFAVDALMQITENLKIQNCDYHPDVPDAMFRQQTDSTPKAYKYHKAPGRFFGVEYDLGREGVAYNDFDYYNVGGLGSTIWNKGWTGRNDGVDLMKVIDVENESDYAVGWTEKGEWLSYTIDVGYDAAYKLRIRYFAVPITAMLHFEADGEPLTKTFALQSTYADTSFVTIDLAEVDLTAGEHQIKIMVDGAGFNLAWFELVDPRSSALMTPEFIYAYTSYKGDAILLAASKELDTAITAQVSDFWYNVNGFTSKLSSVSYSPSNPRVILLYPDKTIHFQDKISLEYNGANLKDLDGNVLPVLKGFTAVNRTEKIFKIPGKIEAEDYFVNKGLATEATTDAGGGFNLGYADNGDYTQYKVLVEHSGIYDFLLRVASADNSGGVVELLFENTDTAFKAATINVPYTGEWQLWQNVSQRIQLPKGEYMMKILVKESAFNLNYLKFNMVANNIANIKNSQMQIWPIPANEFFFVGFSESFVGAEKPIRINVFNTDGKLVHTEINNRNEWPLKIAVKNWPKGLYLVSILNESVYAHRKIIIQ